MKVENATQPKAEQREEVTLIAPHTHERIVIKAGEKIFVTPAQKAFLQKHKKIATPAVPAEGK